MSFSVAPALVPFIAGAELGIYRDHGLDAVMLEGRGSALAAQVVGAGADPIGFADATSYVAAKAGGGDLVWVGGISQDSLMDISFLCASGIEEPADLVGKSVADFAGSPIGPLVRAMLELNGLDASGVEFINVDRNARVPSVIQGQVDAGTGFGHNESIRYRIAAEEAGAGEVCTMRLSDWGVNILAHGVIANGSFAENNPDLVQRFWDATVESWEFASQNSEQAIDATYQYFPGTPVDRENLVLGLAVALEGLHTAKTADCPIGVVNVEDAEQTVQLLAEYLNVQTDLSAAELFSNQYAGEC